MTPEWTDEQAEQVAARLGTCEWDNIPERALPLIAALVKAAGRALEEGQSNSLNMLAYFAVDPLDTAIRNLADALEVES